jgi:D-threonate/D-erythronate kinase
MAEWLVIADDLTGATDTGVQFAERGWDTRVIVWTGAPLDAHAADVAVLVVDTRSRHLPAHEAARRVRDVVRAGRAAGVRHLFKKTDSTLRGNVGAELEALLLESGERRLWFVPALPALGRTTRGGVQYVAGRPLHRTEFAADALDPVRGASVPEILRAGTGLPIVAVDLSGGGGLRLEDLPEPAIVVFDAGSQDDVDRIVGWLEREGGMGALAGTAALGRAIRERSPGQSASRGSAAPDPPGGPVLVVCGSLNPVSLGQVRHAEERGVPTLLVPPAALAMGRGAPAPEAEAQAVVAAAVELIRGGRDLVLASARMPGDARRPGNAPAGAAVGADLYLDVAHGLALIVRGVLRGAAPAVLAVVGGDTLAAVLETLGDPPLLPVREVLPGVPLCRLESEGGPWVASKAGGFGPETLLVRLIEALGGGEA